MIQKTLLAGVLLFTIHICKAQQTGENASRRFGFKAGLNYSHINFSRGYNSPAIDLGTSRKAGLHLGFTLAVPVTGNLSLQTEYLFSQMGGEIEASQTSYSLSYLSLPLLLKYQLAPKFSLLAGPQIDVLLGAKKSIKGSSSDITHDSEERSFGAAAGVEYNIGKNFSLGARYMYGLNNIGIGQRTAVQEFKYELLQLSAGIRF